MPSTLHSVHDARKWIQQKLAGKYPPEECQSLSDIVVTHVLNCTKTQLRSKGTEKMADNHAKEIKGIIKKLLNDKPIQQVLGKTEFYGLELIITKHVFIPRPETEELIETIMRENPGEGNNVLDIGTGSGCIAIALAKNLNKPHVDALDIMPEAILTAWRNSNKHKAGVLFYIFDILKWKTAPFNKKYDIIVSNPPYVKRKQKKKLDPNISGQEPDSALYVPNRNPLMYYEYIAEFAHEYLNKNGRVYFEINEEHGRELKFLMRKKKLWGIDLIKDINGRDRILVARK